MRSPSLAAISALVPAVGEAGGSRVRATEPSLDLHEEKGVADVSSYSQADVRLMREIRLESGKYTIRVSGWAFRIMLPYECPRT
jgi:hypothetical protein